MSLLSLAKSLGGEVSGNVILAPGPHHSRNDRSMTVKLDGNAPDGFLVHSFAGDDFRDCRDHVKQFYETGQSYTPPTHTKNSQAVENLKVASRTATAKEIWNSGRSPLGTMVETYLCSRGLMLPPETQAIRFVESCTFKGERVPAMVCAMLDASTNEFRGVHRTRLDVKEKAMLGPAKGAVIKLTPDEEFTGGLHICEGIETGIALLQRGFAPIWCCLSAGGIANFPVLDYMQCLTIFADNDENQTGQNAAIQCGKRWHEAGREVRIFTPPNAGTDFADWSGS